MKKIKYPAIAIALVFFAYCKTTKKTEVAASAPEPAVVKPGYTPSVKQMEVAERRWPNTAVAEVQAGEKIYVTKCATCHIAFNIMEFGEKKWIREIDHMSPKAELTADEKLKLTKHILSYREANDVSGPKPN